MTHAVNYKPHWVFWATMLISTLFIHMFVWSATTNPSNPDSDGDGYWDGPDVWVDKGTKGLILQVGEDKNANGKYEPEGTDGILETDDDEFDPTNPTSHPRSMTILAIDSDKDGIPYELEDAWGTDSDDADSDDDGVNDGDEIFIFHTSPCLSDSDHDGLPDGLELGLTYSASGDGRNAYNSSWFDQINKNRVFYYKLPFEQQTYYDYAFRPSNNERYRSDPNCYDSDFDQVWDLLELESSTDPMRGLARKPDQDTYSYKATKRMELPTFQKGCAPVNKQYNIYLNRIAGDDGVYQWKAPLTVSLGQSAEPVTLSIETIPASPTSPPYFQFNGSAASQAQITQTDLKSYMGRFKMAEITLVCPNAQELTTLKINVIRGTGDTIQYPVGLNKYYLDPELHDEYFGPNQ